MTSHPLFQRDQTLGVCFWLLWSLVLLHSSHYVDFSLEHEVFLFVCFNRSRRSDVAVARWNPFLYVFDGEHLKLKSLAVGLDSICCLWPLNSILASNRLQSSSFTENLFFPSVLQLVESRAAPLPLRGRIGAARRLGWVDGRREEEGSDCGGISKTS